MNEADMARHQVAIGDLPADPNKEGNPGLNLMPIRKPLNPDIRYGQRKFFSLVHAQANAFIDDGAVARRSAKGVAQQVGRIHDVIEQPDLPKVGIARQVKSKKIIVHCIRDQFDKFDLAFGREPNVIFFDLSLRYTSLHHQWGDVDSCRSGACRGEARQGTFGPWTGSKWWEDGIEHWGELSP